MCFFLSTKEIIRFELDPETSAVIYKLRTELDRIQLPPKMDLSQRASKNASKSLLTIYS
jgi:hypothetical protein